jgi:hypothetical protein
MRDLGRAAKKIRARCVVLLRARAVRWHRFEIGESRGSAERYPVWGAPEAARTRPQRARSSRRTGAARSRAGVADPARRWRAAAGSRGADERMRLHPGEPSRERLA